MCRISTCSPTVRYTMIQFETLVGTAVGSLSVRSAVRRFRFEYGISIARQRWGHACAEEAIELACRYIVR